MECDRSKCTYGNFDLAWEVAENERLRDALRRIATSNRFDWQFRNGKVYGVVTLIAMDALADEQSPPATARPEPKRGPEYGCDSSGWPDVVGDRDRG